jgi:peptidoglycan/xylan/chitin deacetylase (PgdA/CDA1 family)
MSPVVANFHGVGEAPPSVDPDEVPYWLTPAQLIEALDLLTASGAPFLVTFDDGNASDLSAGMPACRDRGIEAIFFVCSDRVGHPGYLDADGLRYLASLPQVGIGSHGKRHVNWRTLDPAALADEVAGSRAELEALTGRPVRAAGLPFGAYDRRVLAAVKAAGYAAVFSSDGGPRLSRRGVQPRLSLRGDRAIGPQVDALLAGARFSGALRQEARVALKSARGPA